MERVLSVLLFALACNLDTLLLAYTYTLRGIALSCRCAALVAASTSVVTGVALGLGELVGVQLNGAANALGALVLLGLQGIHPADPGSHTNAGIVHSQRRTQCHAAHGAKLLFVSAPQPVQQRPKSHAQVANFVVTLALLVLGRQFARYSRASKLAHLAVPASGVLMVVLGILEF